MFDSSFIANEIPFIAVSVKENAKSFTLFECNNMVLKILLNDTMVKSIMGRGGGVAGVANFALALFHGFLSNHAGEGYAKNFQSVRSGYFRSRAYLYPVTGRFLTIV